jgi:hypothetical protein
MAVEIPHPDPNVPTTPPSSPKPRVRETRKPAHLRGFSPLPLVRYRTMHRTGQPGANRAQPGPFLPGKAAEIGPFPPLGIPLNIAEVARMIGCSPWTVRQTLIPRGLPHFRFTANGRLVFYREQVVRWIENQQQGGKTTL